MNDPQILMCAICAIYLSECFLLASKAAYPFRRGLDRKWRAAVAISLPAFLNRRLVSENPLPGVGCVVVGEDTPPPLAPLGVCCVQGMASRSLSPHLEYSAVRHFSSNDCSILADSKTIFYAGTAENAKYLSDLLCRLKGSTVAQREVALSSNLRQMLDTRAAARRWRAYRRLSIHLSFGSWMLLGIAFLFIVLTVVFRFRISGQWPLAIPTVVFIIYNVTVFNRIHKILFPRSLSERWKQIVLMLLAPTTCIRANEALTRELFFGFHCLVVSKLIMSESESRRFTSRVWRELIYRADFDKCEDSCAAATWVDHNWRMAVSEWITKEFGGSANDLLEAPSKISPNCRWYCPRCLTQYTASRSQCADCPGVSLVSF